VTQYELKTDPATGITLSARVIPSTDRVEGDDREKFLWFVGIEEQDRWLIYWGTPKDNEATAQIISSDIKMHRTVRLIILIGQNWAETQEEPDAFADLQSEYMRRMSKEQYLELMNMTLEQVSNTRNVDEAETIAELMGGTPPSMN
jgi:hypothetical protein